MNYDILIQTVSEIVNNEDIYKNGLSLVYEMSENEHKKFDEHLFYKANPEGTEFSHREEIEVEIGGIVVKFIRKGLDN